MITKITKIPNLRLEISNWVFKGRNDGDQPDSSEKMIGLPNLHLMNHKKQRAAQHKHVQVLELLEDVERQDNTDSRRANPD